MQRVLVTGADGFLGRHIVADGISRGLEVHTLTMAPHVVADASNHVGDITDISALQHAFAAARPQLVMHLAAAGVHMRSADMWRVNADGTQLLIDTSRECAEPPRLIAFGTLFEHRPSDRPLKPSDPLEGIGDYAKSKAEAFRRLMASGLNGAYLRLSNIYGVGQPPTDLIPYIVGRALRGERIDLSDCRQERDYMHISDLLRLLWQVAEDSQPTFKAYNVGTGKSVSVRSIVELAASELQRHGTNPRLEFDARPRRPDEPVFCVADISDVSKHFGWQPTVPVEAGIPEVVRDTVAQHLREVAAHQ